MEAKHRAPRSRSLLLLVYRLPSNPTRYRVSVWRRLRALGARSVHRAACALDDTPLNRLELLDIGHDIENWGGDVVLFSGEELRGTKTRRR